MGTVVVITNTSVMHLLSNVMLLLVRKSVLLQLEEPVELGVLRKLRVNNLFSVFSLCLLLSSYISCSGVIELIPREYTRRKNKNTYHLKKKKKKKKKNPSLKKKKKKKKKKK